jgi:hypothetical protein
MVRRANGRTRMKPGALILVRPFTHTCAVRTAGDSKRRKAAADRRDRARERERIRQARQAERERQRQARGAGPQHHYATCRDDDCRRMACRAYQEGYANGLDMARHLAGARGPR